MCDFDKIQFTIGMRPSYRILIQGMEGVVPRTFSEQRAGIAFEEASLGKPYPLLFQDGTAAGLDGEAAKLRPFLSANLTPLVCSNAEWRGQRSTLRSC